MGNSLAEDELSITTTKYAGKQGTMGEIQQTQWGRFRTTGTTDLSAVQGDFKCKMFSEINEDYRTETKGKSRPHPGSRGRFEKEKLLVMNSKVITTYRYQFFCLSKF